MADKFYIQSFMHETCLAYCYSYLVHRDNIDCYQDLQIQMTKDCIRGALEWQVLSYDGYVLDADRFIKKCSCGKKIASVVKKDITSLEEVKTASPVRFDYKGKAHWVVVENGKIIFDTWNNSECVKYGKPATMREITWKN